AISPLPSALRLAFFSSLLTDAIIAASSSAPGTSGDGRSAADTAARAAAREAVGRTAADAGVHAPPALPRGRYRTGVRLDRHVLAAGGARDVQQGSGLPPGP